MDSLNLHMHAAQVPSNGVLSDFQGPCLSDSFFVSMKYLGSRAVACDSISVQKRAAAVGQWLAVI